VPAAVLSPAPAKPKVWIPKRVLVTRAALEHEHGRRIADRCEALGLPVERLGSDRLPRMTSGSERERYRTAKSTLAVVVAPPSGRRPQPIPPSADWQFHLARGCPAHCQYCYLAGSLPGPPITRAFANLDEILGELVPYVGQGKVTSTKAARAAEGTTFEASCYTDPLGIEHVTGSLARTVEHFGAWGERADVQLRFTTKFDGVDELVRLDHGGHTRVRLSVNAPLVAKRYEGGTAPLDARLHALRRLALAGFPVGLTIAPIMPLEDWRAGYQELLDRVATALDGTDPDLTVECITHRFTETSRAVLQDWYPASTLEMDDDLRALKRTKFGGTKHVYPKPVMAELKGFIETALATTLPEARLLYWT
jgi:spore photoproduct lyase